MADGAAASAFSFSRHEVCAILTPTVTGVAAKRLLGIVLVLASVSFFMTAIAAATKHSESPSSDVGLASCFMVLAMVCATCGYSLYNTTLRDELRSQLMMELMNAVWEARPWASE